MTVKYVKFFINVCMCSPNKYLKSWTYVCINIYFVSKSEKSLVNKYTHMYVCMHVFVGLLLSRIGWSWAAKQWVNASSFTCSRDYPTTGRPKQFIQETETIWKALRRRCQQKVCWQQNLDLRGLKCGGRWAAGSAQHIRNSIRQNCIFI